VKIPIPKQYGFLLSNKGKDHAKIPSGLHTVDVKLKIASLAGCTASDNKMVLVVDEEDRVFVDEYLRRKGITEGKVIVGFQVGAADTYKMWPLRNFVELGRKLASYDHEVRIVLTGSGRERDLCAAVENAIGKPAVSVAGELTLKQVRALIKAMKVLVTNDTGTMHMAVALQTGTVSLFCPTDPLGVGPVQDLSLHKIIKKDRPCSPCVTKKCKNPFCMELITVDEVYKAVREMLQ
jgi:ADP-heptose:LPS heptosyltransferase